MSHSSQKPRLTAAKCVGGGGDGGVGEVWGVILMSLFFFAVTLKSHPPT